MNNDYHLLVPSIHQGLDNYHHHGFSKQKTMDQRYNRKYANYPWSSIYNAKFQLRNDSLLWEI